MTAAAPTLPLTELTVVTEPGVYPDMPAEVYHSDPVLGGSLSASGAKKLLPPSCPAKFDYQRMNGQKPKKEFDFGHVAHRLVLGVGPEIVVVQADSWRTNAAKKTQVDARAAGAVPILAKDYETAQDMAAALRAHPAARALFDGARGGRPEQSLFTVDERSKVWRRARLDWFPVVTGRRLIIPDYKTTHSADPETLEKVINDNKYHMSAAWYIDVVKALGLADDVAFVFVFQEKDAPYVVTVSEPEGFALRVGRELNRRAIEIYKKCSDTGRWPGYSDEVVPTPLPAWVENRWMKGFTP